MDKEIEERFKKLETKVKLNANTHAHIQTKIRTKLSELKKDFVQVGTIQVEQNERFLKLFEFKEVKIQKNRDVLKSLIKIDKEWQQEENDWTIEEYGGKLEGLLTTLADTDTTYMGSSLDTFEDKEPEEPCFHENIRHHYAGMWKCDDCDAWVQEAKEPHPDWTFYFGEKPEPSVLEIQKQFRESKCPHETIEHGLCLECGLDYEERLIKDQERVIDNLEKQIFQMKKDIGKIERERDSVRTKVAEDLKRRIHHWKTAHQILQFEGFCNELEEYYIKELEDSNGVTEKSGPKDSPRGS